MLREKTLRSYLTIHKYNNLTMHCYSVHPSGFSVQKDTVLLQGITLK